MPGSPASFPRTADQLKPCWVANQPLLLQPESGIHLLIEGSTPFVEMESLRMARSVTIKTTTATPHLMRADLIAKPRVVEME